MLTVLADLHVHTLLSPCAEVEMTPHHIVLRAAEFGIGAVAVTDHNGTANVEAALRAAERYNVHVFPGMEAESAEEAHLLTLFDTLEQLRRWQELVDAQMSGQPNRPEVFGAQFVVDDDDNFLYEEKRMLHGPLRLTAAEIVRRAAELGGITIAAHIDRPSYSLVGQLGFIEPDFGLAAAEISATGWRRGRQEEAQLRRLAGFLPYVTSSDAHNIYDFVEGPKNLLTVAELTVAELKLALAGQLGRRCEPGHFAVPADGAR